MGGEWTTRRRTISESEIALFAALAGDFSPLSVDTSGGGTRLAQPALLVAAAIGLGSMDMPIPQVASWEWLNWKFPKPVKAGETIYARWTLTQKRAPIGGSHTAIVVWRVDVHTADGALCAEGEVGASIFRRAARAAERAAAGAPAAPAAPVAPAAPAPRRRRRRRAAGTAAGEPAPPAPTPPATAAPPAGERTGGPRRRRRRRPSSSGSAANGESASAAAASEPPPAAAAPTLTPAQRPAKATAAAANPLSRVMRRLRRT